VASRYEKRLGIVARETAQVREQLRREQALLREEVAAARAVAELLRDPATRVVALNELPPAPGASGRVIWHDRAGGRLYVAGLPPAPPGKTYELWTIAGAAPRPAGTFDVDTAGRASHPVSPVDDGPVKVFAVTLEPAGGVPAPTGPMVLASK
jgi:anti-sigma-K factor RskA